MIAQTEFVPKLAKMLQETPEEVVKALEELRSYSTFFLDLIFPPYSPHDVRVNPNSDEAFGHPILGYW